MSLRHIEIAEAGHRILNPFTDDKLALLGEVCRLRPGQRLLDLAWWTISHWLDDNPGDPDAPAMRQFLDSTRSTYVEFYR